MKRIKLGIQKSHGKAMIWLETAVKPYFQKGHHHYLVYSLDGSITGHCSGFYVPPVRHLKELEFYIKARKKLFYLGDYITEARAYSHYTEHFYSIGELGLKIRLCFFVVQEFPAVIISLKANKKSYEVILKYKLGLDYMLHSNEACVIDVVKEGNKAIASSRFDKHLKTVIQLPCSFRFLKDKSLAFKLSDIDIAIAGSSHVADMSSLILKSIRQKKRLFASKKRKYNSYLFKKAVFSCSDKNIENAYVAAKHNIRLLRHYQPQLGQGFFAGIPQYPEFFGRDSFWSLPGIIMSSDFENARYSLSVFIRYQSRFNTETKSIGEMPHEIWLHGEPNYYSADSTMLFIYAAYYYYLWTADKGFILKNFHAIEAAFSWMKRHTRKGFITNRPEGFLKGTTWMDSYNRSESAVEMQALLARCSFFVYKLAKLAKKKELAMEALQLNRNAKKKLKAFWTGSYYADRIKKTGSLDKAFTCNQLIPLMFGYATKKKAEKIFELAEEKKLITKLGIRTRAKLSSGYDAGSYHKGMVWPLASAWGLFAALKYNKLGLAKRLFASFYEMAFRYVPGMMPECVHGNKLSLKLSGEKFEKSKVHFTDFLQLWSAAMFVQATVEGLFGIRLFPKKKTIKIKPVPAYESFELKNLRVFGSVIDIAVRKGKTRVKVKEGTIKAIIDNSRLIKGKEDG